MKQHQLLVVIFLAVLLAALSSGCGSSGSPSPGTNKINLIFVVSEDLNYNAAGDINPTTANLTDQGLQRTLQMAAFLQQKVLASNNVTDIYALEPMTHLQTYGNYPDIVPLWTVQQFALLNHATLSTVTGSYTNPASADSFPINTSYSSGSVPGGAAAPAAFCSFCQGIDFNDTGGDNQALVNSIVKSNVPGYYVFSAPWETASAMMAAINSQGGYHLSLPASYQGPNYIYSISITPSSNTASLVTYNSGIQPSSTYPTLPAPVPVNNACNQQTPFSIAVSGGSGGARVPAGINTNETIYMIRHAESGVTDTSWDDGNYVGAGQWRALDLPAALQGKMSPSQVYSIDPAQFIAGTQNAAGNSNWSYVRAALTAEPYAIANNLPYNLAANFEIFSSTGPASASNFFFQGGRFSGKKLLVAWEHTNIPKTINALIASYYPSGGGPVAPSWPSGDFDTIWTVTLDSQGNLTVGNATCEGIRSATLPGAPPQF